MNTAWTISAGATWFLSMVFVTINSTDSSAASRAPARGLRAAAPLSLWPQVSEGNGTASTPPQRPPGGNYSRHTELCLTLFLEYLTNELCKDSRWENGLTRDVFGSDNKVSVGCWCSSAKAVSHCNWKDCVNHGASEAVVGVIYMSSWVFYGNFWNHKPSREQ